MGVGPCIWAFLRRARLRSKWGRSDGYKRRASLVSGTVDKHGQIPDHAANQRKHGAQPAKARPHRFAQYSQAKADHHANNDCRPHNAGTDQHRDDSPERSADDPADNDKPKALTGFEDTLARLNLSPIDRDRGLFGLRRFVLLVLFTQNPTALLCTSFQVRVLHHSAKESSSAATSVIVVCGYAESPGYILQPARLRKTADR